MVCYSPMQATFEVVNGKKVMKYFKNSPTKYDRKRSDYIVHSCGQCLGCRLDRSKQWALRCMHEASLYDDNCFLTLTYNDSNLPYGKTLVLRDLQLFMKRLRKKFGDGIRYYACGEYGSKTARPHYHLLLFNFDFQDKVHFKTQRGNRYYISRSLCELWPQGHCVIGNVTFESAAYVARYILKKVLGKGARDHYTYIDSVTGEVCQRKPEFTVMSRRGGIGKDWFDKNHRELFPSDFAILKNTKYKVPKYYNALYEILDPQAFEEIKKKRIERCAGIAFDGDRLDRRHRKKQVDVKRLLRDDV